MGKKRIGVVGGGISGLTTAWLLKAIADVVVFEASPKVGGHANTVEVERDGVKRGLDTAFVVYNDRNYPLFSKLLGHLGVQGEPTTVSFAVRDDALGVEYATHNPRTMLSQPKNLIKPELHRLLWDALRFRRAARRWDDRPWATLGDFLTRERFGEAFRDFVALPLTATVWSIDVGRAKEFPFRVWWKFLENHGFDTMLNPPTWYSFPDGSRTYVRQFERSLGDRVRTSAPVASVRRAEEGVWITPWGGEAELFDEVVMACHSDQALRMLESPTAHEAAALEGIPYSASEVALHVDPSVLPRDRGAWSAWNYLRNVDALGPTVTYDLNVVQGFSAPETFCVSLNETKLVRPESIIERFEYSHPRFFHGSFKAQEALAALSGTDRVHYAGAYTGMGFHEDGVRSATVVARRFGVDMG